MSGPWGFCYCRAGLWVITADGPDAKERQDMKKWKRYRSFRRLVVAFAAVAVAVPVAQAQAQVTQQNQGLTQSTGAQTAKRIYGIPADAYRRLPADDQEALRPPRYAPSVRVGGSSPSTPAKTDIVNTSTPAVYDRSEEHTSELQSQSNLVCRLLLEKKKH